MNLEGIAMFCPKCGRQIPDGSICPCSAGTSVLSSNPALNVLKSIGSSPMFLVSAILVTVSVVLSFISGLSGENTNLLSFYVNYNLPSIDLSGLSTVVSAILTALPGLLIAIGMWMHWATCRSTASGNISTAGMTLCKVVIIVRIVLFCLIFLAAIVVFTVVMISMGGAYAYSFSYDVPFAFDGDLSAYTAGFIVGVVIGAGLILGIALSVVVSEVRTINRIKATAYSGMPDNRISRYLTVWLYIFTVCMGIGALAELVTSPLGALASLVDAVGFLLIALCLGRYRKQMTLLMYPPVQPVYAQPVQPAQPYQGYVQQPAAPVQQPYQTASTTPAAPAQQPSQAAPAAPAAPEAPAEPPEEPRS